MPYSQSFELSAVWEAGISDPFEDLHFHRQM